MEQGSDTLDAHYRFHVKFVQGRFEMVDFRDVPFCLCLVLYLDLLLELRFSSMKVFELAYFYVQGFFNLVWQLASPVQVFVAPLILVFCLIAQLHKYSSPPDVRCRGVD